MSEIDELHASLLKTNAKCFALETLCLSLFKHHSYRDSVIAHFLEMKERIATKALNDDQILDPVPAEIDAAHEHIYSVMISLN